MEVSPEIIDIGNLGDDNIVELKPSASFDDELDTEELNKPSVNFGSGIELLMNDKKPNEGKGKRSDIKIDHLEITYFKIYLILEMIKKMKKMKIGIQKNRFRKQKVAVIKTWVKVQLIIMIQNHGTVMVNLMMFQLQKTI